MTTFYGKDHTQVRTITIDRQEVPQFLTVYLHDDIREHEADPRCLYLIKPYAGPLFDLLGIKVAASEPVGEVTVAAMQSAIVQAHGKLAKKVSGGRYDALYFQSRLDQLAVLVNALESRGATHIAWR